DLNKGSFSEIDGKYSLNDVPSGTYTVEVSRIGLQSQSREIMLRKAETVVLNFILIEAVSEIHEVEITAKSKAEEVRESGYAVKIINTKEKKDPNSDIDQVLKSTSGVHIRESGGLGSD